MNREWNVKGGGGSGSIALREALEGQKNGK